MTPERRPRGVSDVVHAEPVFRAGITRAERATLSLMALGWEAPEIAMLTARDEPAIGRTAVSAVGKLGARDVDDAVHRARSFGILG